MSDQLNVLHIDQVLFFQPRKEQKSIWITFGDVTEGVWSFPSTLPLHSRGYVASAHSFPLSCVNDVRAWFFRRVYRSAFHLGWLRRQNRRLAWSRALQLQHFKTWRSSDTLFTPFVRFEGFKQKKAEHAAIVITHWALPLRFVTFVTQTTRCNQCRARAPLGNRIGKWEQLVRPWFGAVVATTDLHSTQGI